MKLNKNQKTIVTLLAIGIFLGGIFTYHIESAESSNTAASFGIIFNYPNEWKSTLKQSYITKNTKRPSLTISSKDNKINVSVYQKYIGDVKTEYPNSDTQSTKSMLISTSPVANLPGVSDIQWVHQDFVNNIPTDYVAAENLIANNQLTKLGLAQGKTVITDGVQALVKPTTSRTQISIGFNSQEPLTLEQAKTWFQRADAKAAHTILLSAREIE